MIDPPDLSPGSSPWDTNRTNRTRSSGGKYESAHFLTPASFFSDALNLLQSNLEIAAKELEVAMGYRIYILIICCLLIVICLALCIAYMKFLKIDCLPKSSKASEASESDDETKDLV